ncbi:hypothetical protein ACOMHN_000482 [Nucella lapillus]
MREVKPLPTSSQNPCKLHHSTPANFITEPLQTSSQNPCKLHHRTPANFITEPPQTSSQNPYKLYHRTPTNFITEPLQTLSQNPCKLHHRTPANFITEPLQTSSQNPTNFITEPPQTSSQNPCKLHHRTPANFITEPPQTSSQNPRKPDRKLDVPPKLLRTISSLHEDMKGTVQYDGPSSDPPPIKSGAKQGCVPALTLFGILFSLLLRYAFSQSEEGINLHTISDSSPLNPARLRAKTKVQKVLILEMLFVDDAALTAHTEATLQELISRLAHACTEFGLTISIKKTNVLGQDASPAPHISIGDCTPDAVEDPTYLGSTISSSLSLDIELNSRIGKAPAAMAHLSKRVWENSKLTIKMKTQVHQACALSTPPHGSESWTLYTHQERRPNTFHPRCPRRILGISWQDRVPNKDAPARAGTHSMPSPLTKRRPRWPGHATRMQDGRPPKDILYGEPATGSRPTGRPALRYKDVCKRNFKAGGTAPANSEALSADRSSWQPATRLAIKTAEQRREGK